MNMKMTALTSHLLMAMVMFLGGCAQTQQTRSVEQSGFLGDYSMLREGEKDEARLVYMNPKANWVAYKKVMIDPVTIWLGKDSDLKKLSPEERQRLANELWAKLTEALRPDYEIVQLPGPGVLRFQAAITDAEASMPGLDTVSSIVPQLRLLTGAKGMVAGGKPGFVGEASVEAKITDAQSGELLAAAVDRRAGTKSLRGSTNSWNDVEQAYQYWADKLRWRLCELRGGANCIEAKE